MIGVFKITAFEWNIDGLLHESDESHITAETLRAVLLLEFHGKLLYCVSSSVAIRVLQ